MRTCFLLLFLSSLSFTAAAAEVPSTTPFAERYPPSSITSSSRAEEVIHAYEEEKRAWENWYKEESAECYRKFFVTYCLDSAKEKRTLNINEARRVWLIARDLVRKEKNAEAVKDRKQRETEQAAKNAKLDAQPPRKPKEAPKARDVKPRKGSEGKEADRVLTPEQEKANEEAYAKKQEQHENRVSEQQAKEPQAPSVTPEERVAQRAQRRTEMEKKRQENIKKRAEKAAEYERQVKMREEQKEKSLTESLIPHL